MPKALISINRFEGGLVNATNARDIPDNALSLADNIILDERNSIKTLGGNIAHQHVPSTLAGGIAAGAGVFVYESDHEAGSGSLDTGENWLAVADGLTGTVDLYSLTDDSFIAGAINLGTVTEETLGANKLAFTQGSSGALDTIVRDDGSFLDLDAGGGNTGGIRKGDIISLVGVADTPNNFASLKVKDVVALTITLDHSGELTTDANESGTPVLTKMFQAEFYYANEGLRVADRAFGEQLQPYKYLYIKRSHFYGTNAVDTFDNWLSKANTLAVPSNLTIHASNYPGSGTGFEFTLASGSANTGLWRSAKTYQFALSFIYDESGQESLLFIPSTANTFSPSADFSTMTIELRAKSEYEARLSGARIYYRENGSDDPWGLFTDISMRDGARTKLSNIYNPWENGSDNTEAKISNTALISNGPNLETYEILNGFAPDETKITISGNGEGYKTSIVANKRTFVANVKTLNNDGELVQMRDRIMYSPVNKFDTFPRSYFVDVVQGDSEEYVKLEEFSDRLLAFKQKRLYILNISGASSSWFLEDIKDFCGISHPSASVKTEFGVVWANEYGVFLYDGRNVTNLIRNKIKESEWESFFSKATSLGYNPKKYYVVILNDSFANTNSGTVYIYDFRTQSFVKGTDAFDNSVNRSNMVTDWNGNMLVAYSNKLRTEPSIDKVPSTWESLETRVWESSSDNIVVKEWSDNPRAVGNGKFIIATKDFDLGVPAKAKKLYAVTITYKSDTVQTNPIFYAIDGSDTFVAMSGDMEISSTWKKLRAIVSSPIEFQSIKIKIENTTTTSTTTGIEINDISIEYRALFKRVTSG